MIASVSERAVGILNYSSWLFLLAARLIKHELPEALVISSKTLLDCFSFSSEE